MFPNQTFDRESYVNTLCVTEDFYEKLGLTAEEDSEDSDFNFSSTDLDFEGESLFDFDEQASDRRPRQKINLKTKLTFSSKYMKTMDTFNISENNDLVEVPCETVNVFTSLLCDKFISHLKRTIIEECDVGITIPDAIKTQIEHFKYLPKIEIMGVDLQLEDNVEYPEDLKMDHTLKDWNHINEMNSKCSAWLKQSEIASRDKPKNKITKK